jgi:hypothetical protein
MGGLYAVPLILGSLFTLVACAVVLTTYFRFQELRRHPNSIVVTRSIFDAALAILIIIEQSLRVDGRGGVVDCRGFSFFFELLLIASELCFLALSYDLYTALHNPFVDYKSSFRKYLYYIGGVSVVMAAILVGSGSGGASVDMRGPRSTCSKRARGAAWSPRAASGGCVRLPDVCRLSSHSLCALMLRELPCACVSLFVQCTA